MYNIEIKIEGFEKRKRNSGLLHLLIGFFFIAKGADYYRYLQYRSVLPVLPFLALGSVSIFYGVFRRRLDPRGQSNHTVRTFQFVSFLILGIMLVSKAKMIDYTGVFVFGVLSLVLLLSERKIFLDTVLKMDNSGVTIPGYFRDHHIPWTQLSDIRIREDFITLFHVRQRYLQFQVTQDLSPLELAKLSTFAHEKIQHHLDAINLN